MPAISRATAAAPSRQRSLGKSAGAVPSRTIRSIGPMLALGSSSLAQFHTKRRPRQSEKAAVLAMGRVRFLEAAQLRRQVVPLAKSGNGNSGGVPPEQCRIASGCRSSGPKLAVSTRMQSRRPASKCPRGGACRTSRASSAPATTTSSARLRRSRGIAVEEPRNRLRAARLLGSSPSSSRGAHATPPSKRSHVARLRRRRRDRDPPERRPRRACARTIRAGPPETCTLKESPTTEDSCASRSTATSSCGMSSRLLDHEPPAARRRRPVHLPERTRLAALWDAVQVVARRPGAAARGRRTASHRPDAPRAAPARRDAGRPRSAAIGAQVQLRLRERERILEHRAHRFSCPVAATPHVGKHVAREQAAGGAASSWTLRLPSRPIFSKTSSERGRYGAAQCLEADRDVVALQGLLRADRPLQRDRLLDGARPRILAPIAARAEARPPRDTVSGSRRPRQPGARPQRGRSRSSSPLIGGHLVGTFVRSTASRTSCEEAGPLRHRLRGRGYQPMRGAPPGQRPARCREARTRADRRRPGLCEARKEGDAGSRARTEPEARARRGSGGRARTTQPFTLSSTKTARRGVDRLGDPGRGWRPVLEVLERRVVVCSASMPASSRQLRVAESTPHREPVELGFGEWVRCPSYSIGSASRWRGTGCRPGEGRRRSEIHRQSCMHSEQRGLRFGGRASISSTRRTFAEIGRDGTRTPSRAGRRRSRRLRRTEAGRA